MGASYLLVNFQPESTNFVMEYYQDSGMPQIIFSQSLIIKRTICSFRTNELY